MSEDLVITVLARALTTGAWLALPLLGVGLLVGLAVAVVQAATQIQESSLTFVPKLAATAATLVFAGSWAIDRLAGFTAWVMEELAHVGPGVGG